MEQIGRKWKFIKIKQAVGRFVNFVRAIIVWPVVWQYNGCVFKCSLDNKYGVSKIFGQWPGKEA